MRVKDKSIIVTGSGGGIGEGIANRPALEVTEDEFDKCYAVNVLYLASDEAAFISGVCPEVDGARCV